MKTRLLIGALLVAGCANDTDTRTTDMAKQESTGAQPPIAEQRQQQVGVDGNVREDEYYWMRDDKREDPDVLAYLNAENAYLAAQMGHTETIQATLYQELVSRIDPDESSVPSRHGNDYYYVRYEPGKEQAIHARRIGAVDGPEEILLDENVLGEPYEYYRVGGLDVTKDDQWLVWAEDTVSRRQYDIRFKNLKTGEVLDTKISGVTTSLALADDSRTLFYTRRDPETLRAHQVWRHVIGTSPSDDQMVYDETDSTFSIGVYKSRDKRHIMIYAGSTLSTEILTMPADNPASNPTPFLPREADHEYQIDPLGDVAYVLTNWNAPNFRIMRAPLGAGADKNSWEEVVAHRDDVLIGDFDVFDNYLVVEETKAGVLQLQIIPLNGSAPSYVKSDEPAYVAVIGDNPNTDTDVLRYEYSSLTTPDTVYDLNLTTGERTELKRDFAGDDFDRSRYRLERVYAKARDGEKVPVTMLMQKGAEADGTNPTYVLGYGAYGSWYEPEFRSDILSMVDRGFIFAIAHIRGGSEMGRRWYDDGKLFNKLNTFYDFIDVGRYLVGEKWADPSKIVGMGRSAGGLLIGAVANMAPETYSVLVTEVPFVDVMTTMEDETIPLTTFEYDEWGNPADQKYYDYMLAYSPYDQVEAQDYPHLLVSTGLWDSQVQYWEPAKWVARLRRLKTNDNRLLMYTDMNAGHGGGSGRYERQRDTAREFAFILDTLGIES